MKRPYNFDNKFLDWMKKAANYYHQSLSENSAAVEYLNSRGIIAKDAVSEFRLGFCDGSFGKTLNEEERRYLFKVGLFYENGNEKMFKHLVFPLWDKQLFVINNFYGRHISRPRHFYLQNTSRSLFNPTATHDANEIIITESIIDALAFWSMGLKNVIPIYGVTGWTKTILNHLKVNQIKHVVVFLDSDAAGRKAAQSIALKLTSSKIESRIIELPDVKDVSELISWNCLTQVEQLMLKGKFRELRIFSDEG